MRSLLRLSERGKLILGTALVILELVAVLCLFDWQGRKDTELTRHGVNIEAMIGGGNE